ncbi:MAG: 30S ribosomal protein S9 [Candidatus Omnitrophica bacterium]|nr:30S ribosomal protein S9 [Candidatus Omnitrophota bacterium]MDD5352694.1 30S ribosomal protein S9 [Candidatus Omnitrophota bacterium]MDD5550293.1 30S ribosomal protein S9 [Candidatus Omnitrophota bacterium]
METITKYKATGRRKESIATVELFAGNGEIVVNKKPCDSYFLRETDRLILKQPLKITNTLGKVDITARVMGGGTSGQSGALRLGIARALALMDDNLRLILRKEGFLTRDPRSKERKKYGLKGARKRFQWTKR